MPCLVVPKPPIPTLPSPFSIVPTGLPALTINPQWCCQLPPVKTPALPIPMPPLILNPAVDAALRAATSAIMAYFDAIPLTCPREQ